MDKMYIISYVTTSRIVIFNHVIWAKNRDEAIEEIAHDLLHITNIVIK